MQPTCPQGEKKNRARSPVVLIEKSSTKAFTDEGHFPRHYNNAWRHTVRRTSESDAINSLKAVWEVQQHDNTELLYISVSDYEIYTRPEKNFLGELHSLDYMDSAGKKLHFSGVLSLGSTQHYVQGVPIESFSIEGYGVDDDPNTTVYIVSPEASNNKAYDIWYKLGTPSRQYKRFQDAFQWIATLGKHVIDYLEHQQGIGIADFRRRFDQWLQQRFPNNLDVVKWREVYGSTDFRKIVHAHISYLWSEAICLQSDDLLQQHPLWKQCGRTDDGMIEPKCTKTVATPHVYTCFKKRYFAEQLTEIQPSGAVLAAREHRIRRLGLPSPSVISSAAVKRSVPRKTKINIGDVVCIAPDEFENRMWRKTAKDVTHAHEWIGYVQRITPLRDGRQRLYVLWLYRPEDTTISTTDYPVTKELFMSDNCNCQEHSLLSPEVTRICSVEWFCRDYDTRKEFLVRQKYITETNSFVTMKETDFRCSHFESTPITTRFQGDTVYLRENDVLEPVVIEKVNATKTILKIRRLERLSTIHGLSRQRIAANELVWTDKFEIVTRASLEGNCYVRFFTRQDIAAGRVPFPYDQGGLGHCWILSTRLVTNSQKLEDLTTAPQQLHEGPNYASLESSRLPGLSLFSGLGNLDKGLEAGGAVHFHTSIDMNGRAIQTLHANADDPDQLKLWFGSVDDYLYALLSDESPNKMLVANVGDVVVIAGGSPCPGFSKLQQNWLSEQSLRNAAHVTTFASFVDIYRPEYGFLENVVNMGVTRKGFEEELVLSQLIGCLVSMGYQVQQFIMSSWHYGSPQHRNRLILSIAAPGRTPLTPPCATHSDPDGFKSKSVGKLLNGERFGVQEARLTPFRHVTPGEKLGDLPNIGCGIRHPCIRSPDHVLRCRPNIRETRCMARVPTNPPGVGLEYAVKRGLVPKYLYETRSEISSKSYKRIKKDGLIGTIVTAPSPHDSRAGPFVHWEQNRCITLEEARLAQDIPTEEVLIGNISDQYKMVGNAVDRRVSKALGLELRRAMDVDARRSPNIQKHSVSVVINVKGQTRLDVPTIEGQPSQVAAAHVTQDVDVQDDCDDISTVRELDIATTPGSTPQDDVRRSTSFSSRSGSATNTISEVDEDDDGPIPSVGMRGVGVRLSNSAIISERSIQQRDLEAQVEHEFGFDLQVKPGGIASWDDAMVEFDDLLAVPALAMSRTLQNKRPREQSQGRPSYNFGEEPRSVKRVKEPEQVLEVDDYLLLPNTKVPERTAKHDEKPRKTRHSGLGIDFIPQNWSKTVEREVKVKTKTVKKFQSKPYA